MANKSIVNLKNMFFKDQKKSITDTKPLKDSIRMIIIKNS